MSEYSENATLIERIELSNELQVIRVLPDSGVPIFEPGQYAELALLDHTQNPVTHIDRRAYSIASAPSEKKYLEFYLVLVPGGILTPHLLKLPLGGRLWVGPKIKGKFTLGAAPTGKDFVFVATGTGLAPFVSMLREYKDLNRWNRAVIIHGARHQADLGYVDELTQLSTQYSNIFYIPTLTREEKNSSWTGHRGRILSVLEDAHFGKATGFDPHPETTHFFLCGNPDMINSMEARLVSLGFKLHSKKDPGNIHFESYW